MRFYAHYTAVPATHTTTKPWRSCSAQCHSPIPHAKPLKTCKSCLWPLTSGEQKKRCFWRCYSHLTVRQQLGIPRSHGLDSERRHSGDNHALNAGTKLDSDPVTHINDFCAAFPRKIIFSTTDLVRIYYPIPGHKKKFPRQPSKRLLRCLSSFVCPLASTTSPKPFNVLSISLCGFGFCFIIQQ